MKKNRKTGDKIPQRPGKDFLRVKMMIIGVVIFTWYGAVTLRLAKLTMYGDTRVEEFSERQRTGSVNIHLARGMIYDRNMDELAMSIDMYSVYVNPRKIDAPEKVVSALSHILEPDSKEEQRKFYKETLAYIKKHPKKAFLWVKRKAPPEVYQKIKDADMDGVGLVKESKRFYPKRDLAAKIVGFCGMDNQGLGGMEYLFDNIIRPVTSSFTVLKDALGRPISMPDALSISEKSAPMDIVLTIDDRIQYVAERALERKVLDTSAKGGVAIVMDPSTGDILAMAEQPKFNPNNYDKYDPESWKPTAVSHTVEPGSTFKLFVAAAAVQEKLMTPDSVVNCEEGAYSVAGHTIREAHHGRYGLIKVSEIIAKSSNIGAIKIGESLGAERLRAYLENFGFGQKTGVDLPGEVPGRLRPLKDWSGSSLSAVSFGQEIGVTPMQLVAAISAIANGGSLVRPNLIKAFMRSGELVKNIDGEVVRRVISEQTAKDVTGMMVGVVEHGTGGKAAIPGFSVAGKTGTAQKIDPATRTYSAEKYLASFIGFFPAENPKLAILVMVDEPHGVEYGGAVAAPVFSEIGSRAARILRIPSTGMEVYEIDWRKLRRTEPDMASVENSASGSS